MLHVHLLRPAELEIPYRRHGDFVNWRDVVC